MMGALFQEIGGRKLQSLQIGRIIYEEEFSAFSLCMGICGGGIFGNA